MKIGILTYHGTRNIGAALQAYALQTKLNQLGNEVELIDYECEYLLETYKVKKLSELNSSKELVKRFLSGNSTTKSMQKFNKFISDYQKMSTQTYNKFNIESSNEEYDLFVVGSDQVWNMNLNGNDSSYLLDFVKKPNKKISYAASFGYKEIPEKYLNDTVRELRTFDAISVRESSGKKLVSEFSHIDSTVVVDPTLLLKKSEWEMLNLNKQPKKEYILVYIIAATPSILEFAKTLSKKYNCDIICIHNSFKIYPGVKNVRDCSPDEFLDYVKYAKAVVSSSFHGICFSIIFKKEFYFELDTKPLNNNSRIESLISKLDLWTQEIKNGEVNHNNTINYDEVMIKLDDERKKSIDFIMSSLN